MTNSFSKFPTPTSKPRSKLPHPYLQLAVLLQAEGGAELGRSALRVVLLALSAKHVHNQKS